MCVDRECTGGENVRGEWDGCVEAVMTICACWTVMRVTAGAKWLKIFGADCDIPNRMFAP